LRLFSTASITDAMEEPHVDDGFLRVSERLCK